MLAGVVRSEGSIGSRNGIIRAVDDVNARMFNINKSDVGKWAIIIPKAPIVIFDTYDDAWSFLVCSK